MYHQTLSQRSGLVKGRQRKTILDSDRRFRPQTAKAKRRKMKECLPIWTVAVRPGEAGSLSQVVYTEPLELVVVVVGYV